MPAVKLTYAGGTGENVVLKMFQGVCGRTMMLKMIVTDTSDRMTIMTGSSGTPSDYAESFMQAVEGLKADIPKERSMVGIMNRE
ncbi:hypothetical protein EYC80_004058 [Monilinia laxa]|uniref:Uncharacterized protein n=1 Tax=Monilinia laxa TaxID=61186 RepID=A0A5N6KLL8_MONLA|nr:hypothetical protein EYC80_004058 [Monilinia laxa]